MMVLRLPAVLFLAGILAAATARGDDVPLGFSGPGNDGVPDGWKHVTFPSVNDATQYTVADEGSTTVVHAFADKSASFLIRQVPAGFDADATPLLAWCWRVEESVPTGDGKEKSTDDFPARVWVGFETDWSQEGYFARREAAKARERYGFDPPGYWIHYVWAGTGRDRGESFDEPYSTDRFKCMALRTGDDPLNQWFPEKRDPRADFEKLFGRKAPRITAIAIMTDTDDTAGQARASFADLAFVAS